MGYLKYSIWTSKNLFKTATNHTAVFKQNTMCGLNIGIVWWMSVTYGGKHKCGYTWTQIGLACKPQKHILI